MEDPRCDALRTRRRRRALVGAMALVLVLAGTRGVTERPAHRLDEHGLHLRLTAAAGAYRWAASAVVLAVALGLLADRVVDDARPVVTGLILTTLGALLVAPACVAAWTAPDEDDGEGLAIAAVHAGAGPARPRIGLAWALGAAAAAGAVIGVLLAP